MATAADRGLPIDALAREAGVTVRTIATTRRADCWPRLMSAGGLAATTPTPSEVTGWLHRKRLDERIGLSC